MKAWASEFMRAVLAVILLSFLLGAIYPLAAWGIGQLLFPGRANGSLIKHGDEIAGSALIAQPFTSPLYFHPRASAVDYSCSRANSCGSNLGPLSRSLANQVAVAISIEVGPRQARELEESGSDIPRRIETAVSIVPQSGDGTHEIDSLRHGQVEVPVAVEVDQDLRVWAVAGREEGGRREGPGPCREDDRHALVGRAA